jgi:hypothetical protein
MTIEWNDIQASIFMMFHALMGGTISRSIGVFFAVKSDTGQRDITLSLARELLFKEPDLVRALASTFGSINKMAGRRNDFIHGIWQFPKEDGRIAEIWLGVKDRLSGKDPKAECATLRSDIADLHYEIMVLHDKVKTALQEKPRNALAALDAGQLQQPRAPAPSDAVRSNSNSPVVPPLPRPTSEE